MKRSLFLKSVALIAFGIGLVALFFPAVLLESKGVIDNPAASIWMSEVGVLLAAIGVLIFSIRNEQNSLALKAIFIAMTIIQSGLLCIELMAYRSDVITEISGIIPNCTLHVVLILGFVFYLSRMNVAMEKGGMPKNEIPT